jgi:predicted nucleotidyltransferase
MALGSSDPDNQKARETLLAGIVAGLEADERVTAAWLAGSLGRGSADDLSDIDIWIAVHDDALPAIAADPLAFAQELTKPVHAFPVPANAPPGGAYLFSIVDAGDSLQQVEWYREPASAAARPRSTRMLFEHPPVPLQPPPPGPDATALNEFLLHCAREALAMAFIAVKPIRRKERWVYSRHIHYIAQFIAKLAWASEHRRIPVHDDRVDPGLPQSIPVTVIEQRDVLLTLLDRLERHLDALPLGHRADLDAVFRSVRDHIRRHLPE